MVPGAPLTPARQENTHVLVKRHKKKHEHRRRYTPSIRQEFRGAQPHYCKANARPARLIVAKEHHHTPVGSLILACALSLLPGGKPRLVSDAVAHVRIFDSTVREAPFVCATDDVVESGVRALRCANAVPVFSGCKGQTAGHGRLPLFTNPCWVQTFFL